MERTGQYVRCQNGAKRGKVGLQSLLMGRAVVGLAAASADAQGAAQGAARQGGEGSASAEAEVLPRHGSGGEDDEQKEEEKPAEEGGRRAVSSLFVVAFCSCARKCILLGSWFQ